MVGFALDREDYFGHADHFFKAKKSPIKFKRLGQLRLTNGLITNGAWEEFLDSVKDTLETLYLCDIVISSDSDGGSRVLPFPLPHLKWFATKNEWRPDGVETDQPDIGNVLLECPKLEQVDVSFRLQLEPDVQALKLLRDVPAIRNVAIYVAPSEDNNTELYEQSKLDIVKKFAENVTRFDIFHSFIHFILNPSSAMHSNGRVHVIAHRLVRIIRSTVLDIAFWQHPQNLQTFQSVIDNSKNLTDFSCSFPAILDGTGEEVMTNLTGLFKNQQRAGQLRLQKLVLTGRISGEVLDSVFENCLHLEKLSIVDCSELNDGHLIRWTERGARPITIRLWNCENITDKGLIPVLISTAGWIVSHCIAAYRNSLMKHGTSLSNIAGTLVSLDIRT